MSLAVKRKIIKLFFLSLPKKYGGNGKIRDKPFTP